MKKWILNTAICMMLPAFTACSASAKNLEGSSVVSRTVQVQAMPENAGIAQVSSTDENESFFDHWIEVCDPDTGELQWYMRMTGRVVVFVYPNSDYWDGSEYVFNISDGWYYTGTGGNLDKKSFALIADNGGYILQMAGGSEYTLQEIREKAKWLRPFEEMIQAFESGEGAVEGHWVESAEREFDEEGRLSRSSEREYDSYGNETYIIWYGDDGYEYEEYMYEYDAEGRILSETHTSWSDTDSERDEETVKYTYDENGNLVHSAEYIPDREEPTFEKEYQYDAYGNCICETHYSYGDLCGRDETEYEYDENGNVTAKTVTWYEPENWDTEELEYGGYARFEYDAEGREVKQEYYNRKGECYQAAEYRYDDKGRLVYEMSGYYQDYQGNHAEDVQIREYEYDDENALYSIIIYWNDRLYLNGSVFLNENGDETKRVVNGYDQDGNVFLYTEEYTYDENGNRIRIDYYDGRDDEYTHDEFEYVYIGGETEDFFEWGEAYLTGNH